MTFRRSSNELFDMIEPSSLFRPNGKLENYQTTNERKSHRTTKQFPGQTSNPTGPQQYAIDHHLAVEQMSMTSAYIICRFKENTSLSFLKIKYYEDPFGYFLDSGKQATLTY